MFSFDDLLTARILAREQPETRDFLLSSLDTLSEKDARGLLAELVDTRQLSLDQAQWVQQQVSESKRLLGMEIYASLLYQAGLPAREVYGLHGQQKSPQELGQALVDKGLLTAKREQEMRFRARIAFDRDVHRQMETFLEGRQQSPAPAQQGEPTSISQVVKLPGDPEGGLAPEGPGLSPEEFMHLSSTELMAPRFPVPEWVDTSADRVGKEVAGHQVLGRIGRGASGTVYLAMDPALPTRPVALKLLRKDASDEARGRFERAAVCSSMFRHPGALHVFGGGTTDDGVPWLATEFFDGVTLSKVLASEGRLAPRRALSIACQVLAALAAAHGKGVVHRDVKPENILLSADGEKAKLTDFGIAVLTAPGGLQDLLFQSSTGKGLVGTPMYASPEQAFVRKAITPQADLYSLGLVIYEMLSGRLPFEAENAWAFVSCHMHEEPTPLAEAAPDLNVPKALHELLDGLLRKDPQERPTSAEEVIAALDEVSESLSTRDSGRWLFGLLGRRG